MISSFPGKAGGLSYGKMDRRVRKTRALLLQGLVKMLETHDIQDISVKELTELVDINRGTFYLHYDDIYDMLHKIEDEMFLEFNEIMEQKPVVTNSLASQGRCWNSSIFWTETGIWPRS